MDSPAKFLVLLLDLAFFFALGWYFYLICKLWGKSGYGGKTYNGALIKAMASGVFLFLAATVANLNDIPKEVSKVLILVASPLFLVGVGAHWWREKSNSKSDEKPSSN